MWSTSLFKRELKRIWFFARQKKILESPEAIGFIFGAKIQMVFCTKKPSMSYVCSSRFVYFPRQFYVQLSKCHHRKLKQGDIFDKNGLEFQVYIDRVMIGSAITMKLIQKDGYDEWGNKNHNFMPGFLTKS